MMVRSVRDVFEVISAILLGLVSVATAFGAYQASVWSTQAAELASISQQARDLNLTEGLTTQLVYADDSGKMIELTRLTFEAQLYPDRAEQIAITQQAILQSTSPEFAAGWEPFEASRFAPEYIPITSAAYEAAIFATPQSLQYVSYVADRAGDIVGDKSDGVTVAAIVFAIALFLLGVAGVTTSWRLAAWLIGGGGLAFLAGVLVVLLAA